MDEETGEGESVLEIDEGQVTDLYAEEDQVPSQSPSPVRSSGLENRHPWKLPDGTSVQLSHLAHKTRKLQKQSAMEGLSTLQDVALVATPKRSPNNKRKRSTKTTQRQGRTKRAARDSVTITVKEHQFSLPGEDSNMSLYKLARLWMDDNTSTPVSDNHTSTTAQEIRLPPPEPHTKHSQSRSPPRSVRQSTANFDELLSAKDKRAISELKENYTAYGKVLRTWFHSQYLHRLNRYKSRIRMYHEQQVADGGHDQAGVGQ